MSKKSKLLEAMKNNPKNIDFNDIKRLLLDNGYECTNNGSSHYVFRKDGYSHITIPFARPIKAIYVKQVLEILEGSKWKPLMNI